MDNISLAQLIDKARGDRSYRQYALYSDVSPSMLSQIISQQRRPKPEILRKLALKAQNSVTYDDFMFAAGYTFEKISAIKKAIQVPVLGTIPAGIPIEAIEEILDYEEITEDMAKRGSYFGLKVRGNSMAPRILDGDVVIVRMQSDADTNDICVAIVNGFDATLKQIKKENNGIWLIPHNKNDIFKPVFYDKEQVSNLPVKIIGKVVELRGKFK